MTRSEYLEKFTKVVNVPSCFMDGTMERVVVTQPNYCYLTLESLVHPRDLKGTCADALVDFLAEHEIVDIESSFSKPSGCSFPVANIGFSEKEQKWYGWSHRAIFGFGIGSHVKKGDCAYCPCDMNDFVSDCVRFWADPDHKDVHVEDITDEGFDICWTYSDDIPNESIRATRGYVHEEFPKVYGRGEWTAETLEDARQMAIDFANNVA